MMAWYPKRKPPALVLQPNTITYTNPDTGRTITLTGFDGYAEGAKAARVMLAHLETQARLSVVEFAIENRISECRG